VNDTSGSLHRVETVVALALLIALGAWFRQFLDSSELPGFTFARHDEEHYVELVIQFLHGRWDVHHFINPTFYAYLVYAASSLCGAALIALGSMESWSEFVLAVTLEPFVVTMSGRVLSCAFSIASIVALYALAQKVMPVRSAALAPVALAVCLTPADRAMLAGNESLLVLLVLLFFLAVFAYLERPSAPRHLWCGVWLGLGIATKYSAGIAVPALLVATALVAARTRPPGVGWIRHLLQARFIAGFALAPVVFAIATPQALVHFSEFWAGFSEQSGYLHQGWTLREAANPRRGWWLYPRRFAISTNGVAFAWVCALGIALASWRVVRRRDPRIGLVLLTVVSMYAFLGSGIFVRMRFLLPVIPLILLLGAWGLDRLVQGVLATLPRISAYAPTLTLGVGVLLLVPAMPANFATLRAEYGRPDPRTELLEWARAELRPDRAYLQFGSWSRLRLLSTRDRIESFGIDPSVLRSDAERRRLRDFLDATPRVRNLESLLWESPSYEAFAENVRAGGYRRLLVVTPERPEFEDLANLSRIDRTSPIAACTYWDRLVAALESRQPNPIVVGRGAVKMRVYPLPL